MKVDVTDVSPVKKTMAIEVEADDVQRETKEVMRSIARDARLPGFRKGKVPDDVIRSRFGDQVRKEVRERVISRSYFAAAQQQGLQPVGDPVLDEVEDGEGGTLTFKTTFEVLPDFELKGHRGVEVRRRSAEVDDKEIDEALERIRQSNTKLQAADEGAAGATGDVLVVDLKGSPADGEAFEREKLMIEIGATDNLPAFNENLEGATAGQELSFSVDYPAEYPAEALAGKTVGYAITVHEVKHKLIPDLDDEFAKDLGQDDLAALKGKVREDLENHRAAEVEREVRQRVLDKVLLENPVVLPEVLVQAEIRRRLEEFVRSMYMQGVDPEKAEIDWEAMRKQQEEPAQKTVHAKLLLDAVARVEEIAVDDKEIEQRIRQDAERMGEKYHKLRQDLEKHNALEALRNQLVREKSLDLLTAVANIQNEE